MQIKSLSEASKILVATPDQDDPLFEAAQVYIFQNSSSQRAVALALKWLKNGKKKEYLDLIYTDLTQPNLKGDYKNG